MKILKSKKGFTYAQVVAASVILSFMTIVLINTVKQYMDNTEAAIERREVFNATQNLYHHLEATDNSAVFALIEADPQDNGIEVLTYADCNSAPLNSIFTDVTFSQSMFAPTASYTLNSDQIEVYIYKHNEESFLELSTNVAYPQLLREHAAQIYNSYASDDYYYKTNNPIFGISIISKFDNYTKVQVFSQVIA
jgi:hypothetical protein